MSRIVPAPIIGQSAASGAQVIDGSLNFEGGKNQALKRTPTSVGNRKIWTWSCWLKKQNNNRSTFFSAGTTSSDTGFSEIAIGTQKRLRFSGWNTNWKTGSERLRDYNNFYHFVIAVDYTNSTASNKVRLYKNGVEVTDLNINNTPSDADRAINDTVIHYIGGIDGGGGENLTFTDYRMSQVYFIDGQQLGPEYFGFTDPLTGTWRPKKFDISKTPSGSWGTNGFYLPMDGNSPIGQDKSGIVTPNNGSIWSDSLTVSSGFRSSEPKTNAFDGNTSSICSAVGSGTITFTSPVTFASNSTIRVFLHGGDHTVTVNGGSNQTISAGSFQTVTYSNSGNANFVMTFHRGGGADTGVRAIEINNHILVDGQIGNNWTPVNFGGSAGIDQATGALPILNTTQGGTQATVGVRTDAYASNLVVAMPLVGITEDVSNRINSGTTAKTVSQTGSSSDIAASTEKSNFYASSAKFNGNVARLEISGGGGTDGDYDFGTGDFTMECWFYPTATVNTNNRLFCSRGDRNNYQLMIGSNKYLQFDISGTSYTSANNVFGLNKWHHFAATRQSGTLRLFVNGVIVKEQASVTADLDETTGIDIGYESGYASYINGYMQDARVYKE